MNKQEAYKIAQDELRRYESCSYADLAEMIGNNITDIVQANSGIQYQVDAHILWDDNDRRNIRIMVAIDDMSWFAFAPITESIVVVPE